MSLTVDLLEQLTRRRFGQRGRQQLPEPPELGCHEVDSLRHPPDVPFVDIQRLELLANLLFCLEADLVHTRGLGGLAEARPHRVRAPRKELDRCDVERRRQLADYFERNWALPLFNAEDRCLVAGT